MKWYLMTSPGFFLFLFEGSSSNAFLFFHFLFQAVDLVVTFFSTVKTGDLFKQVVWLLSDRSDSKGNVSGSSYQLGSLLMQFLI